jgi:maleylacetate reductase
MFDVPHGYTSCAVLPHVLRFNSSVNSDRQAAVSEAMARSGMPAADAVAELVSELGLPGSPRELGISVAGAEKIASAAMVEPWTHTNPRKIRSPDEIVKLLFPAPAGS